MGVVKGLVHGFAGALALGAIWVGVAGGPGPALAWAAWLVLGALQLLGLFGERSFGPADSALLFLAETVCVDAASSSPIPAIVCGVVGVLTSFGPLGGRAGPAHAESPQRPRNP